MTWPGKVQGYLAILKGLGSRGSGKQRLASPSRAPAWLQDCLQRNTYTPDACSAPLLRLYECCDRMYGETRGRGSSTACPMERVVKRWLRDHPESSAGSDAGKVRDLGFVGGFGIDLVFFGSFL